MAATARLSLVVASSAQTLDPLAEPRFLILHGANRLPVVLVRMVAILPPNQGATRRRPECHQNDTLVNGLGTVTRKWPAPRRA